jgi:methionyl-tRNA synthetase
MVLLMIGDLAVPHHARQRFLLIGSKPATNGGLHLGHVGGPYLRMDILRRHLLRLGHDARVVFGTDPHDSYVTLMAKAAGKHPLEVAAHFHDRIVDDLRSMHIHTDAIINPTVPPWTDRHVAAYRGLLDGLLAAGEVEAVPETLWHTPEIDQYGLGGWVNGDCPHCRGDVGGYFCEHCGAYMEPSEIVGCAPRTGMTWNPRQVTSMFHSIRDVARLERQLAGTRTPREFIAVVERQLRDSPRRFRLASPRSAADWGLQWTSPDGAPFVMSVSGVLFAYCLLCGEAYQEVTGDPINPFHAGSPVRTVNFFGLDNTISHMIFIQELALTNPKHKPFDHFVVNYFRTLEHEKFSTSRRHAIWASDIVGKTPLPGDVVRLYLAARDATHERSDFGLDDCVSFVNERWIGGFQRTVNERTRAIQGQPAREPPAELLGALRSLLERQRTGLDFPTFDLREVVSALFDWLPQLTREPQHGYWQLKGLALLAYPVLPAMSCRLWSWLGGAGEPTLERFPDATRLAGPPPVDHLEPINRSTLTPCLPDTLRR